MIFILFISEQLNAARASLPPERLQYQSFESYPEKKGAWYSDNVKLYQIKALTTAAFRGQQGVILSGKADGELLAFRLPLNPANGGARKIKNLSAHRGRFMLRSSCRGVVRYILRARDGTRLFSPWVAFRSSPSESLKSKNPDTYLTQTWSAHWQQVELPNFKPLSSVFKTKDGEQVVLNEEIEPEALDFRCRGDVDSFELHVDEFNIDIEHLMNYKKNRYEKMPLMNVAGNFPRPACLFASPQYLESKTYGKEENSSIPSTINVFKETELKWRGSQAIIIKPQLPVRIATDKGVVGLRMGLRSSGTSSWKLKLVFAEEKLRQANDGREPYETFATYLPLDFRGLRYFEIPLCFTGLPLRPNYRLHNKQIDGSLRLETLILEPIQEDIKEDTIENKLGFVQLEQWVEREDWNSSMTAFPSQNFPKTPILNSSVLKEWPYILKDMEILDTFNRTFKSNEQTWVEEFDLNQSAAFRGRHGLAIKLSPEFKVTGSHNLQATFFFKQSQLPPLSPKGEFQFSIRGRTSQNSRVSLWLKDDLGQIFASPYQVLSEQKKNKSRHRSIEWNDFLIADSSLKSYRIKSKGPKASPKLPFQPYAIDIQVPKARSKVLLHFDDLAVWTPISKPRLWRKNLQTYSPFFRQDQNSDFFQRSLFCSSDDWVIRHIYVSKLNLATGLPNQNKEIELLKKAELRYNQAKDKLAIVKKLDKKSTKGIEDFFKDYQCASIEGAVPELLHFYSDSSGLELSLNWNEHKNLNPWEKLGCSGVSLESAFWNRQTSEEQAWIPVSEGVIGMVLSVWTTAHLDTSLRLLFVDEEKRYFVRQIPLDQAGLLSHNLAFSKESFRILSESGRRIKDQKAPQRLRLLRVELEHAPKEPKHTGIQNLKLYPIKWLIDRKKKLPLFKD